MSSSQKRINSLMFRNNRRILSRLHKVEKTAVVIAPQWNVNTYMRQDDINNNNITNNEKRNSKNKMVNKKEAAQKRYIQFLKDFELLLIEKKLSNNELYINSNGKIVCSFGLIKRKLGLVPGNIKPVSVIDKNDPDASSSIKAASLMKTKLNNTNNNNNNNNNISNDDINRKHSSSNQTETIFKNFNLASKLPRQWTEDELKLMSFNFPSSSSTTFFDGMNVNLMLEDANNLKPHVESWKSSIATIKKTKTTVASNRKMDSKKDASDPAFDDAAANKFYNMFKFLLNGNISCELSKEQKDKLKA